MIRDIAHAHHIKVGYFSYAWGIANKRGSRQMIETCASKLARTGISEEATGPDFRDMFRLVLTQSYLQALFNRRKNV